MQASASPSAVAGNSVVKAGTMQALLMAISGSLFPAGSPDVQSGSGPHDLMRLALLAVRDSLTHLAGTEAAHWQARSWN